jgi:hypothetical protein
MRMRSKLLRSYLNPRPLSKDKGLDRGLVDRGRGCDKGAITGSKGVSGLQKWPSGAPDFN